MDGEERATLSGALGLDASPEAHKATEARPGGAPRTPTCPQTRENPVPASLYKASAFLPCSCLLRDAGIRAGESASVDFPQDVKLLSDLALLSITDTCINSILA